MAQVASSLILITLLVKLGVAAAVSSSLARSNTFKRLLLAPYRSARETFRLVAWICVPLVLGVAIRVRVPNFLAADLSIETVILLGVLVGPLSAMAGGAALALPALLHFEIWSLPVNLLVGALAGAFGNFANPEDVWSFSPLVDLSIYRWFTRNLKKPQLDRQILLLVLITLVAFGTSLLSHFRPHWLFGLYSPSWLVELAICVCAPVVVGIPLKIWNQIRIEQKLEEQSRLLLEARLDALQRQINPHFLFNTLNSITSLVRSKPELAREMIVKLANILRMLLKDREAFVPFSDELAFTDDYLDIEVVRFGDKLRVVKEIAPETLSIVVPSMLLQPLIENSIKHGLEPRIGGGTVTLRSRITDDGRLTIEVEDDGIGMPPNGKVSLGRAVGQRGTGIGMRNVRERMEVLYGIGAEVTVQSSPGRGTRVTLMMPVMEGGGGWGGNRDGTALR
ncbi:two-component system, LytT family, sensor kinase [Granulicella rosea]|uniref:histidine kinase n=1 Tax=Granulicella rosea TaxID=474952 RepID=A0A239HB09_9BACT|nr:histidine kinase [Granulicella rosea]SNS78198.1 two-component system, LytT family, sensor kinase [Granulicella rosea]